LLVFVLKDRCFFKGLLVADEARTFGPSLLQVGPKPDKTDPLAVSTEPVLVGLSSREYRYGTAAADRLAGLFGLFRAICDGSAIALGDSLGMLQRLKRCAEYAERRHRRCSQFPAFLNASAVQRAPQLLPPDH
jgi:hypothetical protein